MAKKRTKKAHIEDKAEYRLKPTPEGIPNDRNL